MSRPKQHSTADRPTWLATALALLLIAAACTGKELAGPGPSLDGRVPTRDQDCQLGMWECSVVYSGIQHLQGHPDPTCVSFGNQAMNRFNAPDYGFRWGNQIYAADMYTRMQQDENSSSGWSEFDPSTYVNGSTFTSGYTTNEIGALIGHEEIHHSGLDGPNHNTGQAAMLQGQCGAY